MAVEWKIRYNSEINDVLENEGIVRFIKSQRILQWLRHIKRKENSSMSKIISDAKVYNTRRRGRPKVKWIDNVSVDLRILCPLQDCPIQETDCFSLSSFDDDVVRNSKYVPIKTLLPRYPTPYGKRTAYACQNPSNLNPYICYNLFN